MRLSTLLLPAAIASTATFATSADAALFGFETFNGNVKVSNDGACDGNNTACDGTISASTEAGSTVLAAYLYTSMTIGAGTPTATLNSNALTYTELGANDINLQAFRADVTDIVAPVINGGGGGVVDFDYDEGASNRTTDGSALVVVYENAALPTATVAILDGFSATTGDQFVASFADPVDTSDPNFSLNSPSGLGLASILRL